MPAKTKIFVSLLAILGLADLAFSAVNWHLYEPRLFLSYLTMAVLSSVVQASPKQRAGLLLSQRPVHPH